MHPYLHMLELCVYYKSIMTFHLIGEEAKIITVCLGGFIVAFTCFAQNETMHVACGLFVSWGRNELEAGEATFLASPVKLF